MFFLLGCRPNHYISSERTSRVSTTCTSLKLSTLSLAMLAGSPSLAIADEPAVNVFNTTFLQGAQSSVDLQQLLSANSVLPGNYRVDLYSNEVLVGRRDIDFKRNPQTGRVDPCLTLDLLKQLGIDMMPVAGPGQARPQPTPGLLRPADTDRPGDLAL